MTTAFVFQSLGKPSRFSNTVSMTGRRENRYRILGVFVEVRVEDTLILKVGFSIDFENLPAQIMQLEHGEAVRLLGHGFLDLPGMLVEQQVRGRGSVSR